MSKNRGGTLVSAAIRPNDTEDQIATAYINEIKGGLHSYEKYTAMNSIIESRRQWGMFVTIYNDGDNNGIYQLRYKQASDITNNDNWVKTGIDVKTEWVDSVKEILLSEPSNINLPSPGDRYLLGTKSTDILHGWNGILATTIVEFTSIETWEETIPKNGMTIRVDNDKNSMYRYDGIFPTGEWFQEKITNVFYIEPTTTTNFGVTYSVNTTPKFNSYTKDLIFFTKFYTSNSGSASLNINGLGYRPIKMTTTNGNRDLLLNDIDTNSVYTITYNTSNSQDYFQLSKQFTNDAHNTQHYIAPGETITVKENEQYWVYGDLNVQGTLIVYGKVIIANGTLKTGGIIGAGSIINSGEIILVDLFNTPTFNITPTIQMSSVMTINGPSVSSTIRDASITPALLNSTGASSSYILSNDSGNFKWVKPNNIPGIQEYSDNTTALSNGLVIGDIYRTGDTLKIVY